MTPDVSQAKKELEELNRQLTKSFADMLAMYKSTFDKKILDLETKLLQRMDKEIKLHFDPILENINKLSEQVKQFRNSEKAANETIRQEMNTKAGQLKKMLDEFKVRLDKENK